MPSDDAIIRVVCAIIRDKSGRVLAAKRPLGKTLQSKWEFPGGKIDASERPEDALLREILEELAIKIKVLHIFDEIDFTYDFGSIHMISYVAEIVSGVPVALEHDELRWLDLADLDVLEWAPADLPIVRRLEKVLLSENLGTGI